MKWETYLVRPRTTFVMTINLTKNKELVVKGKVERPLPTVTFDIKQEVFFKLLGLYFHSDATNWDKQIDSRLRKAGRHIHISRVCKKCGYSLDSLHYLFNSLIILMAFQCGVEYFYSSRSWKFYC